MGSLTNIDQGLYAVLGAASLMAGSMRMTVSLCVIFLELTNNLLLLPITMIVLLTAKSVGDCINPSIYEIILDLKGLPFLDANPEPWMRNLTVGELAEAKPSLVTLCGIEKVGRIVDVLRNTTHNCFPVVDEEVVPPAGCAGEARELHGLILRAHLLQVLKKKWFLQDKMTRREDWEVSEIFSWIDLAEREVKIEEVAVTREEMEMFVDLHPFTNTTPYTVVESMSVAKAKVLFRQVGLRHMLIVPKYQAAGVSLRSFFMHILQFPRLHRLVVRMMSYSKKSSRRRVMSVTYFCASLNFQASPVVGILTRQDLRAHNILMAFPHLAKSKGSGHWN